MMDFVVAIFKDYETESKRFYTYAQAETYYEGIKMTKDFDVLTLLNGFGVIIEQVTNL